MDIAHLELTDLYARTTIICSSTTQYKYIATIVCNPITTTVHNRNDEFLAYIALLTALIAILVSFRCQYQKWHYGAVGNRHVAKSGPYGVRLNLHHAPEGQTPPTRHVWNPSI